MVSAIFFGRSGRNEQRHTGKGKCAQRERPFEAAERVCRNPLKVHDQDPASEHCGDSERRQSHRLPGEQDQAGGCQQGACDPGPE
jgi:hypothetical protein